MIFTVLVEKKIFGYVVVVHVLAVIFVGDCHLHLSAVYTKITNNTGRLIWPEFRGPVRKKKNLSVFENCKFNYDN